MSAGDRRMWALALVAGLVAAIAGGCAGTTAPTSPSVTGVAASGPPATRRPNDIPQPPAGAVALKGAGSGLAVPLYQVWLERFGATYPDIAISYDGRGSAAGIEAVTGGSLAFGATDVAMTDAELAAVPAGVLHVPTALAAISLVVNLPGVTSIQLDGTTVAAIFLGRVLRWSDPAIVALNAGVALPDLPIAVVHRSDPSGGTAALATWLAAASPEWRAGPGVGRTVFWPVGRGAKGDDGMIAAVKAIEGAIGYAGSTIAGSAGLRTVKLKNPAGTFVRATSLAIGAAGETSVAGLLPDFRQTPVINAPGINAYPIVVYAFVLVRVEQADRAAGQALVAFLAWALTSGQVDAPQAGFAALPGGVQSKALAELHRVTSGGSPIWP